MTRHRLLSAAIAGTVVLLAAGCAGGGDGAGDAAGDAAPAATAPAAVALPVAVAPATLGGPVRAGADTPKDVVAALAGDDVVVVAFLNARAADDQKVAAAVRAARADTVVSDGARYFVYTLGGRDFGDLADVLGVEGTPAVAVIGRDRNLANLFTGLIDGDILRQAVWDAADTAAKNVGPGPVRAGGPAGSPAGIAVARRVRAAYRDVPGVAISGALREGGGAFAFDARMSLSKGDVAAFTGTLTLGETAFEMVASGSRFHIRTAGASCWAAVPMGQAVPANLSSPAIPLDGTRFAAPRRQGGDILLDATRGAATVTYAIDAATHRVKEMRAASLGTVTVRALDAVPAGGDPTPVCDDPAQAIDGEALAAFGGTVS